MPPNVCTICTRQDAATISGLLREGRSVLSVAREFGLSEDALQNHKRKGHSEQIPVIPRAPKGKSPKADPIVELVDALRTQALSAHNPAIVHQYRLALAAQEQARNQAPQARTLTDEPEFKAYLAKLVAALEPFPEARIAAANALA